MTTGATGVYGVTEASHLLGLPANTVRRWLGGYRSGSAGQEKQMEPLWGIQLGRVEGKTQLGFLDLMQLRIVGRLAEEGISRQAIRAGLALASKMLGGEHPLVTGRFRTDGQGIFLEVAEATGDPSLIDLRTGQWGLHRIIEPSFKDVDLEDDLVARWWPLGHNRPIVLDPRRSFGKPIIERTGVPIRTLCEAMDREKSIARVARWYEVAAEDVERALEARRLLH